MKKLWNNIKKTVWQLNPIAILDGDDNQEVVNGVLGELVGVATKPTFVIAAWTKCMLLLGVNRAPTGWWIATVVGLVSVGGWLMVIKHALLKKKRDQQQNRRIANTRRKKTAQRGQLPEREKGGQIDDSCTKAD